MISVIIPLYNKEAIIERTLQSVLSQDYDDYEVIIVDDGSTDNSLEICRHELPRLCRELSKNIDIVSIIQQENGGPSKARNTGVKHAKGEWVVFLDADDEFVSGALKEFAHCIKNGIESDFIACPFYCDNGKSKKLQFPYNEGRLYDAFKSHFYGEFLPRTGAFVCRKELLEKNPFDESIRRFEDLETLFRIYRVARIFLSDKPSMVVNVEFAEASRGRKNIEEDFVGHIDFKGKSFWEKMCLYQFYLGERTLYPGQIERLYPTLKYRYDLLVIYKILKRLHVGY